MIEKKWHISVISSKDLMYFPYWYQENQSVAILNLNIHKPDASWFFKLEFGWVILPHWFIKLEFG